jgi:putative ABC transport system permease protein
MLDTLFRSLGHDLRHAARGLGRRPGFTAAVIATLALAIGANGAIFAVINGVLLRPLPFGDPDRLVALWSRQTARDRAPFNLPDALDVRDRNTVLDGVAAFAPWSPTLTGDAAPERLQGVRATANLFTVLRAGVATGRPLVTDDDRPGAPRVVVLADALWRRRFGADPAVLGRRLALDGEGFTVVGILSPGFVLPVRDLEFVAPLVPDADPRRGVRGSIAFLRLVGRLAPGVARERVESALTAIAEELRREFPDANERKIGVRVVPLAEEISGGARASLLALLAAVGAVLLIACANLASLFLARCAARTQERAARLALGATPGGLARQQLAEVGLHAAIGGVAGAGVAAVGVRLLAALAPADLPRRGDLHFDTGGLLVTFGLTLFATFAVGAAPAFLGARTDLVDGLKARARGSSAGRGERRAFAALVGAEIALAFVLLVALALLLKTFANLQAVDPGFLARNAVTARLSLPGSVYSDHDAVLAYQRRVAENLARLPAIESAGAITLLPLSGQMVRVDFTVAGRAFARNEVPTAQYRMVTEGWFPAMGVPLHRGRLFTPLDTAAGEPVVVVNDTLARRLFATGDPIGARLLIDDNDRGARPVTIVGVVGDVKHLALDGDPTNDLYLPYAQMHPDNLNLAVSSMAWVVRTRADPGAATREVRDAIQRADASVPIAGVAPLDATLAAVLAPRRFQLLVIAIFAAAAILLAATGVYAVLSYSVGMRRDELAIRRALGAQPRQILRLVLSEALRPVVAGIAAGAAAAVALARLLGALLFGLSPTDPWTFAAVAAGLLFVGALAGLVPALRAAAAEDAPAR